MKRILLKVEYDGTNYAGWQRQINGLAVQQVLDKNKRERHIRGGMATRNKYSQLRAQHKK